MSYDHGSVIDKHMANIERKLLAKLFFFIAFIGAFLWFWDRKFFDLPREEARWCRQYHPEMSSLECSEQFGY